MELLKEKTEQAEHALKDLQMSLKTLNAMVGVVHRNSAQIEKAMDQYINTNTGKDASKKQSEEQQV